MAKAARQLKKKAAKPVQVFSNNFTKLIHNKAIATGPFYLVCDHNDTSGPTYMTLPSANDAVDSHLQQFPDHIVKVMIDQHP